MTCTFRICLALLTGLATVLPASAALAQDDTQFWLNGVVNAPLADGINMTIDTSQRWREGADQIYLRGNIDVKLAKGFSLGGGAAYIDFAGGHEIRPHQQATLTIGHLALRTRLEERFFAGADRAQVRLRQRAKLAIQLDPKTEASFTAEGFYILQAQAPGGRDGFEQFRVGGFLTRRISPAIDLGAGYLLIAASRPNAPDRYSHVPQLTVTARL